MKKVSEVAELLGVTRQTVYNHIDKIDKEINSYIYIKEGVKVIDKKGIELIKASIDGKDIFTKEFTEDLQKQDDIQNDNVKEALQDHIDSLKSEIERLEKELKEKNKQLDNKDQLMQNFQVMLQNKEDKIYQLEGEVEEQKQSILDKIKDLFKGKDSNN